MEMGVGADAQVNRVAHRCVLSQPSGAQTELAIRERGPADQQFQLSPLGYRRNRVFAGGNTRIRRRCVDLRAAATWSDDRDVAGRPMQITRIGRLELEMIGP